MDDALRSLENISFVTLFLYVIFVIKFIAVTFIYVLSILDASNVLSRDLYYAVFKQFIIIHFCI